MTLIYQINMLRTNVIAICDFPPIRKQQENDSSPEKKKYRRMAKNGY